ncbi:AbrB/MazE/SpoVT family DNA-binding domain-containing protein [bacterium]|nr:AbrB/MazE/SpoVT family DNA-binding domain-containing protein [bacterium]
MRTRIAKWGNSLGLRIPWVFAVEVGVADGTPVELTLEDGRLVIRTVAPAEWTLDGLLAGVTAENQHAAVETGDQVGRESW